MTRWTAKHVAAIMRRGVPGKPNTTDVSEQPFRPARNSIVHTIKLPIPPSVNALYTNRKTGRGYGRRKSAAYRAWWRKAIDLVTYQNIAKSFPLVSGPSSIAIRLPAGMRGDISNRIKAAEDFLVAIGATGDDRYNRHVSISSCEAIRGCDYCEIDIREV
jgi:Holliday junction resolvase RusA-like endonuclease